MKFLLTILVSFILANAQATECVDRYFKEKNINFYLCQNYSGYSEVTVMLMKARIKELNKYIQERIDNGKLENKKFEIKVFDAVLTYRHLYITKAKKAYYIDMSGYPDIKELTDIINYLCSKNSKSFNTCDYNKCPDTVISNQVKNFFQRIPATNGDRVVWNSYPVWKKKNLSIIYQHDTLAYVIDSTQLNLKMSSILPAQIKDRYLFFYDHTISVYEGHEKIKDFTIVGDPNKIDVLNNFVNISTDDDQYSYSYADNKLYAVPKKK